MPVESCATLCVFPTSGSLGPFNYYVTLFLANFDPPPPLVTKCHTGPNPKRNAPLSAWPKTCYVKERVYYDYYH